MGEPTKTLKLRCDKCGKISTEVAKLNEGHYRLCTRVSGIGQKPFTRATRCGTWVAVTAPEPSK